MLKKTINGIDFGIEPTGDHFILKALPNQFLGVFRKDMLNKEIERYPEQKKQYEEQRQDETRQGAIDELKAEGWS